MEVVADEHVGRRRLRRHGLERGMRIEHRDDGEPTRVRHAHHPDAPVVVRDVLDEPLDRVVRVGALVDRLRILLVAHLAEHHELPFGLVSPADVLVHEDVAVARQLGVRAAERRLGALDAVGRADHDDREIAGEAARDEDVRVQLHPVAHGDHRLGLVERRDRRRALGGRLLTGQRDRGQHESREDGDCAGHSGGDCTKRHRELRRWWRTRRLYTKVVDRTTANRGINPPRTDHGTRP